MSRSFISRSWPKTWPLRNRGLDTWLLSYMRECGKRRTPRRGEVIHVLLCIADHYEPKRGNASPAVADERVRCWLENYSDLFGDFRDSDGRPPRHTFFFPQDEYESRHLDALAALCRQGFGEVEVHLHHDNDTAEGLRDKLQSFKEILAERHGLLSRHRCTRELAYAFIHGNWALDNSRPDGRMCGVNNELDVLRETGCYADFTMPSCPSPCQTRKINSIYYAVDHPQCPKSHNWGSNARLGRPPENALLLIQGPLLFNWNRRKWGLVPRVENGCIQSTQAPTMERLDLWLKARVQVPSRPDWYFLKLFMHGAKDQDRRTVLGQPMVRFHQDLARRAAEDPCFHFHYVTAREMVNLVRAAEAGWTGNVKEARDFELLSNLGTGVSSTRMTASSVSTSL
jgi:hypothetical protein